MVVLARNAQQRRRPTAAPLALPPPIGGWNTRDSLEAMEPSDAVTLDNWYPGLGAVTIRGGSASFATGLGAGAVETLAEYYSGTTRKLLGACGASIFNCSAGGAVGAALATGFASDRWQTANFKAKQFWVNGTDAPQTFDGAAFAASGWTGPSNVNNLIGVAVFKFRVFLWEKNSPGFWYAPVNNITGALTFFDLSMVTGTGGNLLQVATLSYTGGNAPDDLIVFIMTSGEAIIYQGTDPAVAANWALVGRYRLGAPINIRSVCEYGGDSYLTTLTDHTSINTWFGALRNGVPPALSKASGAVLAATSANAAGFGWQAIMFPKGGKLLFNIPNADGTFDQHVLNTVTQAWCRYTGLNASCWSLYQDNLYFGGAGGVVYEAETLNSDAGGVAIDAVGQQAWSLLKSPYRKRIAAFSPVIQSAGTISYTAGVGYDFQAIQVGAASSTAPSGSAWNVSPWNTSPWGPETLTNVDWRVAGGSGTYVGVQVNAAGLQMISWLGTRLRAETGIGL